MIEVLIITLLVVWSCIIVFKKIMPKTANKTFLGLSQACQKQGWDGLAKRLAPKAPSGCGGSCGCGSEDEPKAAEEIKAVKWK